MFDFLRRRLQEKSTAVCLMSRLQSQRCLTRKRMVSLWKKKTKCVARGKKIVDFSDLAPQCRKSPVESQQHAAVQVQQELAASVQPQHGPAIPAQQDSALVTSAMCWLGDMRKKNRTYRSRLMHYRRGLLSMRGMDIQRTWHHSISLIKYKDHHTQ